MAACNKFFTSIVFCLAAISVFVAHPNGNEDLINYVCNQTKDIEYCKSVLFGDARSVRVDMRGLALIAIQTAIFKAQDTIDVQIPNLLKTITDPLGHQRLAVCQSDYTDALDNFRAAFQSTGNKAYQGAIDLTNKGVDGVIDCQDVYKRDGPIAESPLSSPNNEIAVKLWDVILTILNNLVKN